MGAGSSCLRGNLQETLFPPKSISQTFAVTDGQQRQQRAPVHALIADLIEGKELILPAGTVELVLMLAVKMEVARELLRRGGNLHLP